MEGPARTDQTAAVAALRDPTRRELFDVVVRSRTPVSIDDAVRSTGIPKSTAALHLDRLVELGVLTVTFERRSGKTGPGAGRPAKIYRAVGVEIAASIPSRDYELMGEVLAGALEAAEASGSVSEAVRGSAAAHGEALIHEHGDLDAALTAVGYEPVTGDDGLVRLTNCPFHRLASTHGDLVCRANLALVGAMVADDETRDAVLAPAEGRCCVQLVPSSRGASSGAAGSSASRT
jgi:predicted ArsR family transcriptional regulator